MKEILAAVLLLSVGAAYAGEPAPAERAKAEAARKKPLQRCDQLEGDAELACLRKAREGIVEARAKREGSQKGEAAEPKASVRK